MLCQEQERLPRRQQGTEAGRGGGWPAAEAWGGGGWRTGGRMSNCKHPHRPARHAGCRDALRTAGCREGTAWARHPPICFLSYPSREVWIEPGCRGWRVVSQELWGFRTWHSWGSAARGLPARHQEGLPRLEKETPFPRLELDAKPPALREKCLNLYIPQGQLG